MKNKTLFTAMVLITFLVSQEVRGAGILTPSTSPDTPIRIKDHQVNVTINNGFARTEVTQVFFNPNASDLEAVYSFPVPKSASLSEMTIYAGESEMNGEVLPKDRAEQVYEEEKRKGNDAGRADKNGFLSFDFRVYPVRANSDTRIRFVYYQPLEIDTGIGRYLYPLEDGGTDEVGRSFWLPNEEVDGTLSVDVELKSAWPITDVRVPGFEAVTTVQEIAEGHFKLRTELQDAALNRDFILYYRLQENLPGRVEMVSYRASESDPGTFMVVVTPGLDLQPITNGADYVFVLDVSGSMKGKIHTLVQGVVKALRDMKPEDRFRIVTFNTRARDLTGGWVPATPANVQDAVTKIESINPSEGTDLYSGINMAVKRLDDDRATSVILVTDAVTNSGIVDPREFHKLLKQYDLRLFGFVIGNSGNWPLMRAMADASGGFSTGVSNADDILGQIMLAKSKVTHESLHDARWRISGVKTFDTTDESVGKIYRGQQLVFFGRYAGGGQATISLEAVMTGEDKTYTTSFRFPEIDTDNPELERLWAMHMIEQLEDQKNAGQISGDEAENAIEGLGVQYQLVTDHTSMVVVNDQVFTDLGIDRSNRQRVALERQAQETRSRQGARNYRVDSQSPAFSNPAPSPRRSSGGGGGGGGAFDPLTGIVVLMVGVAGLIRRKRA